MLNRLTPASLMAANFSELELPGFASHVISAPSLKGNAASSRRINPARSLPERHVGVPPPMKSVSKTRSLSVESSARKAAISRSKAFEIGVDDRFCRGSKS